MIRIKLSRVLGEKRIKQKTLAEMTGLSPNTVFNLYHEKTRSIDFETLDKICIALDCSPDEQRDIQEERRKADRNAEQVVEHGRKTRHPAGRDIIRRGEKIDRQRIDRRAEGYQQIVDRIGFCSVGFLHGITLSSLIDRIIGGGQDPPLLIQVI